MVKLRLRTKFLLSLLLVSSGLTCATLWMVRRTVRIQLREEIAEDLRNSVLVFRGFQRQREMGLSSSAELLANLPSLKALMTTRDAATIQDASVDIWRLAPSDVFVLADPAGRVMAIHTSIPGLTRSVAQELLRDSLRTDQPSYWWYGEGHLYQVFLQPVYFGPPKSGSVLGMLAVGHEISEGLASEVGRIASSQVAFFGGNTLIVSTLRPAQEVELAHLGVTPSDLSVSGPKEIQLGEEKFLATTVDLAPSISPFVRLSVLKSYDKAAVFLGSLNRLLLVLGVLAVLVGSVLVFLISETFMKPLANLVAGVRALEMGDFAYPLVDRSGDEVAEVTAAFDRMRNTLQRSQQELLGAERLVTIGRMASSISHDLRHPLTAIVANAEFLCEEGLDARQREELYREIRSAVDQMTDLVDSLLEFSQARESFRRVFGRVEETLQRAIHTVRARPEFHRVNISVSCEGRCQTWFDQKKVERVFTNLLLNACEAVPSESGKVEVSLRESKDGVEIRFVDNGPGVPAPIREKLFQPFVSYGKQNGIGLGLTISQKIFQVHGGDACLESTGAGRTVFKLTLPIFVSEDGVLSN
ncbi:MAG TPA: HAMP domain-containing sensor histidine kinase [Candidatus Dormibacteraeota bacterium]|nr:HAMP domain-containing sensor histidine kinase [Candidatus Dormibacteraeota bacterium]